jgi:hypothetical protein
MARAMGSATSRAATNQRDAWMAAKDIRTLRLSAELVLHDVDDATRTILGYLGFP